MPRLIIIDSHTGYIWGDTADIPRDDLHAAGFDSSGDTGSDNIIAACRALDMSIGGDMPAYDYVSGRNPAALNGRDGYIVYHDNVSGGAVANIHDGQDAEMIEAVTSQCPIVGVVARVPVQD
jgi:hypothetical protein